MINIRLLKEKLAYYLILGNEKVELNLEKDGTGGCPDCKAVTAGLKKISNNLRTIGVFRDSFASPHKLTAFGHNLKDKVYNIEGHIRAICDLAELFEGIERAYFIESIIKHVQWVNQSDYWDTWHLQFEKKVKPELLKLVNPEYLVLNSDGSIKTFPEYLLCKEAEQLAKLLKEEFKEDIGISIRYMIEVLIQNEPSLLTIENRKRKAVYNSIKGYFDRNIGSYQSVFDSQFVGTVENPDYESTKLRVSKLLQNLTN